MKIDGEVLSPVAVGRQPLRDPEKSAQRARGGSGGRFVRRREWIGEDQIDEIPTELLQRRRPFPDRCIAVAHIALHAGNAMTIVVIHGQVRTETAAGQVAHFDRQRRLGGLRDDVHPALRPKHDAGHLPDGNVIDPRAAGHILVLNVMLGGRRVAVPLMLHLQQLDLDADPSRVGMITRQLQVDMLPLVAGHEQATADDARIDSPAFAVHEIGRDFRPCMLQLAGPDTRGDDIVTFGHSR